MLLKKMKRMCAYDCNPKIFRGDASLVKMFNRLLKQEDRDIWIRKRIKDLLLAFIFYMLCC